MFDESASGAADGLIVESAGQRIAELQRIGSLARRGFIIHRGGHHGHFQRLQVGQPGLVVSQLLTTVPSPVAGGWGVLLIYRGDW